MPEDIALYRVFIATPGGLDEERDAFAKTLNEYNVADAVPRQALFFPVGWEDTLGGLGRPEDLIIEDLKKCDYFVMILWDRWGSPPGGEAGYTSGTEEEFRLAMELHESKQAIHQMVVFFKNVDEKLLKDPGEQLKKVIDFRKELEATKKVLFYTFDKVPAFQERLRRHLAQWLRIHDETATSRKARLQTRTPEPVEAPRAYIAPGIVAIPEEEPQPAPGLGKMAAGNE